MVPFILPENWVLASKHCVKVKNEHFSLGFTVGQGRTILTRVHIIIFLCKVVSIPRILCAIIGMMMAAGRLL
jgi:hypothetical protein